MVTRAHSGTALGGRSESTRDTCNNMDVSRNCRVSPEEPETEEHVVPFHLSHVQEQTTPDRMIEVRTGIA